MVFRPMVFRPMVFRPMVFGAMVFGAMVFGAMVFRAMVFRAMVFRAMVFRAMVFRAMVFRRVAALRVPYGFSPCRRAPMRRGRCAVGVGFPDRHRATARRSPGASDGCQHDRCHASRRPNRRTPLPVPAHRSAVHPRRRTRPPCSPAATASQTPPTRMRAAHRASQCLVHCRTPRLLSLVGAAATPWIMMATVTKMVTAHAAPRSHHSRPLYSGTGDGSRCRQSLGIHVCLLVNGPTVAGRNDAMASSARWKTSPELEPPNPPSYSRRWPVSGPPCDSKNKK